jgi:hypothetical protein
VPTGSGKKVWRRLAKSASAASSSGAASSGWRAP